jgi:tRNA modification GTPase
MTTIAAIITAPGEAAIAAIRISGPESWAIAKKISGKILKEKQVELAWIKNGSEKLDQVIIIPFKEPKSFTGEDVIEIHSHGGFLCVNKILELILEHGARLAKPGEFTQQALLNGKMDLVQAEAIHDLITAKTDLARKNALEIYRGELGCEIKELRISLLNLLGAITASIDFPDEVGDYDRTSYINAIEACISSINKILETEKQGEILRQGYKVALIGKPNVGKSTLLNTLLKKERAIVTEIAGTTRDSLEELYNLDGFPIILYDTAGIRDSEDRIEKIGIEKSISIAQDADLVLELIDLSETNTEIQRKDSIDLLQDQRSSVMRSNKNHKIEDFDRVLADPFMGFARTLIRIGTKSDLEIKSTIKTDLNISAENKDNIDKLKELIKAHINLLAGAEHNVKINQRQADLLRQCKEALLRSTAATNLSEDFWTIDLRNAIHHLGEITGESLTEELLDNIFSRFCIGK